MHHGEKRGERASEREKHTKTHRNFETNLCRGTTEGRFRVAVGMVLAFAFAFTLVGHAGGDDVGVVRDAQTAVQDLPPRRHSNSWINDAVSVKEKLEKAQGKTYCEKTDTIARINARAESIQRHV